jgi:hypothetical protein
MKIDTLTVQQRYLSYFAHIAYSIPNSENRDYERIREMAAAHTLSYFGSKNHYQVSRIIDRIVKDYRSRS